MFKNLKEGIGKATTMRRKEDCVDRRVLNMEVEGRDTRERRCRWVKFIQQDAREKNIAQDVLKTG